MGLVRDVTKNTVAMGLVQVVTLISTFILSIFLARYLGSENYGTYTLAFSLATLVFYIANFNLGFQLVVEVAPNKELAPRFLTSTLFLRAVLGGVAITVTLVIALLENLPGDVIYAILIVALATAFNWLYNSFTAIYTAFEKMHLILWTSIAERSFTITLAIVLIVLGFGLDAVVLVVLAGSILQLTLAYLICSRLIVKPSGRVHLGDAAKQLKGAVPYAISDLGVNSLYSVNAVLVQAILVATGAGVGAALTATAMYNLPFNMVAAMVALPTALVVSLLPVISRMFRTSLELTRHAQQKVMKYMFALGLPLTVGGIILSEKIVLFFYGAEYAAAVPVFCILMPAVAISFFDSGMATVLASARLVRYMTLANVLAAVANVALCIALIPFFHEQGAALAFTLGYLVLVTSTFYFLTRHVFKVNLIDILFRPSLATMGMGVVLLLMPGANLFLALGIGIVTYFCLLFVIKGISQEDREILVKILKKGV
jgi:O-antigen/teichoic acid export membrane protein